MTLQLEPTNFLPRKHTIGSCTDFSLTILLDLDPPVSGPQRDAVAAQVKAELAPEAATDMHPLVSLSYEPKFSQIIEAEHDRLASGAEKPAGTGIDLSRYEADALEPPAGPIPTSKAGREEYLRKWRKTLSSAYVSATYLSGRTANLALLETYGKNAWLVANWHQDADVKHLESELASVKAQIDSIAEQRRLREEAAGAEMAVLEESWKKGVRGLVEVQLATGDLQSEILEKRREAVNG
jgi:pre-mRNA-splicing factor SPF27